MSDKTFVHLHVHTEFSLLDGLSRIKKLVNRAKELDMPALAITDHGTMFGIIDFFNASKDAGIKPIIGIETYLAPNRMYDRDPQIDKRPFHMLLLAKNEVGYHNLLKLSSAAQLEGYYYRPRIDMELLAQHSEGLIGTSGCLAAKVPQMIMNGMDDLAHEAIGQFSDIFGPDNFYLELQHHDIPELFDVNRWLVDYSRSQRTNIGLVATNDLHYVLKEDHDAHDTLLCIQTNTLKNEEKRMRLSDDSYYLTSSEEMWEHFKEVPEAIRNSRKIADMCNVDLSREGYHLPNFPVPDGYDAQTYLRYLCDKGLDWRFANRANDKILQERMDYELGIIHNMGFDTYFLIVWDLCEFARHADIWWNVRGSGAGSLAAYCLGITNIDPIQNQLLFERFLNPGRISMPDIDLDYPDDRRGEMIAYTANKYGDDKVAAIITFGTMGAKGAVRDVGRALDIPLPDVNRIAALIPQEAKQKNLHKYVDTIPDLKRLYDGDKQVREIIDMAEKLQGVSRHASTHAAGVIVADRPLVEYLPLHRITGKDPSNGALKAVTQFPMETCEAIGLLKVDFLGLSTLTILRKAADIIKRIHGIEYTMDTIPYRHDDPKLTEEQLAMLDTTFEMIGRGETIGVFQVESGGMQQMLRGMQPKKFEHIIAAVSLYRPGPMDFIPQFNRRMHGEEETEYRHEKLESILAETYGICISGDSLVFDSLTGERYRVDELEHKAGNFYIQGVDKDYNPAIGRVTHWFNNGKKPVSRITLRNGATIKATLNHEFLTEDGWEELINIKPGDYIAIPHQLLEPENTIEIERDKLRVLAYLIGDGSLASGTAVDFVNKDQKLIDEYVRCLGIFNDVNPVFINQIRDVTRVSIRSNRSGRATTSLLTWMRELGFKYPPATRKHPCGVRSNEKSIPDFIFQLSNEDILHFLASLWDCDGYMGKKFCHYKTISERLAYDVQSLLLRVGFPSTIYRSNYEVSRGKRTAYQVTLFSSAQFAESIQPHLISNKKHTECLEHEHTTISRHNFIQDVKSITNLSARALMREYNFDRQHFIRANCPRISAHVVQSIAEKLPVPSTNKLLNTRWEEVVSIEEAVTENVYDLTVEGLHNFVANGIIVHNCVYQEQIMQIAGELFDYELGEADLMRRAVSKKKEKALAEHRTIFLKRGPKNGIDEETASEIFDDIEFFANYGFNKCVTGNTEIVDTNTGRLIRVEDLVSGKVDISQTLTCDTNTLRLKAGTITAKMNNGVKPVYRLTTQLGRQIDATENHPFYTFDDWCVLSELEIGDRIAVPRWVPTSTGSTLSDHVIIKLAQQITLNHEKDISDAVFELPLDQLAFFIAGLWSNGGFISLQNRHIACRLFTHRQARQLQHLLLRLDILSRIYKDEDDTYIISITESRSLKGFVNISQFFKNPRTYINALSHMLTVSKDQPTETQEIFAINIRRIVEQEKVEKGMTWQQAAEEAGLPLSVYDRVAQNPDDITYEMLEELAEFFNSSKLRGYTKSDIFWDKIVSIEYLGEEPTYDLTIEGTHNFVANDIIVHNSHAADYAVITVQTALLKCHYPEEYMTALLTVQRDNSDKVAHFLEECRRLKIPILAPDTNFSTLDFDIQPDPETGRRGIRFGLAAVKNAGAGALQPIIDARQKDGPFHDLVDFCQRIDLRLIGKRTLESLIKVGAMGKFGKRSQLLASLERIVGFSASYFRDKEVGQMNMFGEATGLVDDSLNHLPEQEEIAIRDMLSWEKELLGLYVSGRPVDKYRNILKNSNSMVVSELTQAPEAYHEKSVQIAGEIINLRRIYTRNNDAMAVIQVEDWHESAGTIEVVLFPRTWNKLMQMAENGEIAEPNEGEVVKIQGKFDMSRGDPQIICETMTQNFEVLERASQLIPPEYGDNDIPHWAEDEDFYDEETGEVAQYTPTPPKPQTPDAVVPATQGGIAAPIIALEPLPVMGNENTSTLQPSWYEDDEEDSSRQQYWLKIKFPRSADDSTNRRLLMRLHGTLINYPGKDRFSVLFNTEKGMITLEFPNHTTGYCEELHRDLLILVDSEEMIEVNKYTNVS